MSVTIRIPTQLRLLTHGEDVVSAEGDDVAGLVADLETRFPGFAARLLEADGTLRRYVNIYIDGEDIRFLKGLGTSSPPSSTVSIVPAVAGG